jgi:hypothetical protein
MKVIEVPPNTRVFLGVPAQPLPETLKTHIIGAVYSLDGVEQLHLPQCFALGIMGAPAQVLVIVVGANASVKRVTKRVAKTLSQLLPPDLSLDIWPIAFDSPFAAAVQQANCLIERDPFCLPVFRKPRPWWRLLLTN